jgi:phosphoglycerate dehydrogenase-like enzyme
VEILLVERLVPEVHAWLQARHSVETRCELASDPGALRRAASGVYAVVLPREVVVNREFLDCAPQLKAVARMHASVDRTDLEACRDRDIRVIRASAANVRSNAEYLLASLLLLHRRGIASSLVGSSASDARLGRELSGSVVGLLGLAATAHTLALMLHGLGVKLLGYDPAIHYTAPIWSRLPVQPVSLPDLMARSDAISVQIMYASRYQGFINANVLAQCKPGQLWVSISRSQLFDADALAWALAGRRIEACMLDGTEPGFAAKGTALHGLGNLFLTPRLGSHTREARLRASWYVAHRIHETLTDGLDGPVSSGLELDADGPATDAPARQLPFSLR